MMDIALHYIEQGEGCPILLLHGNGGRCTYFKRQLSHFATQYHVIALDTRAHGHSPRGSKPFTISQCADDLRNFMREKGIRAAHVLGFSDGGNIALTFAVRYPEMLRSMVVCGANFTPDGLKPYFMLPVKFVYAVSRFFSNVFYKAKATAERFALMVDEPRITPQQLQNISAPTLVIAGTHDIVKKAHTELLAHSLPHGELAYIPGGHSLPKLHPKRFNALVERFLQKCGQC